MSIERGQQLLQDSGNAVALFLAYSGLTVITTWPATKTITSHLIGDNLDPWQTLWGFWWWHHGISLRPHFMFTRLVWWPSGTPVWLETWDIPSALVAGFLWSSSRAILLYNTLTLLTFPLSGLTFYLLCRKLWGGFWGPAASGVLYSFSSFHFANADAVLHMASMEWTPLYVLGLVNAVDHRTIWGSIGGGVAFGVATLASPYHALECVVITAVLATVRLSSDEAPITLSSGLVGRLAMLAAIATIVSGWYVYGIYHSYSTTAIIGSHDPAMFSVDWQSLFLPNGVTVWSRYISAWRHWTASRWSGATGLWAGVGYIGYASAALATISASRDRRARPYLIVALVGVVLALGPVLQDGGKAYMGPLPYAWLVKAMPFIKFGAVPSRFIALTSFGLAAAACPLLNDLWNKGRWFRVGVGLVTALALVEVWPRIITTSFTLPTVFASWRQDHGDWAVLDATWWSRAMYNQTLHQHPILTGYLSRTPEDVVQALRRDRYVCPFFRHLLPTGQGCVFESSGDGYGVADRLRELRVKFVVVDEQRTDLPRAAGLVLCYDGDGLMVYEVPGV